MKYSTKGCSEQYESKLIVHMVKHGADTFVFKSILTEVCDVCSDTFLVPETFQYLERLMCQNAKSLKQTPVYTYA